MSSRKRRDLGQSKRLYPFIVYISIGLGISGCFHLDPRCEIIDSQVFWVSVLILGIRFWDFDFGIRDFDFG